MQSKCVFNKHYAKETSVTGCGRIWLASKVTELCPVSKFLCKYAVTHAYSYLQPRTRTPIFQVSNTLF